MDKWKSKGLQDKMNFGKYKDCRLEFCISNMPEYVEWVIGKGFLNIDKEAKEALDVSLQIYRENKDIGTRVHRRYEDRTEDLYRRFTRYG